MRREAGNNFFERNECEPTALELLAGCNALAQSPLDLGLILGREEESKNRTQAADVELQVAIRYAKWELGIEGDVPPLVRPTIASRIEEITNDPELLSAATRYDKAHPAVAMQSR